MGNVGVITYPCLKETPSPGNDVSLSTEKEFIGGKGKTRNIHPYIYKSYLFRESLIQNPA